MDNKDKIFRSITKNKNILIENLRNWSNNIIPKNKKKIIFKNSNPIIIYGGNYYTQVL